MKHQFQIVGKGIYSLAEVARYTGVPVSTARSWFFPRGASDGLLRSDHPRFGEHAVLSFLDMVDVLVVSKLRDTGVKMSMVREVYRELQKQFDTRHPFAHRTLRTDGKEIFIEISSTHKMKALVNALTQQRYFETIIEPFLKDLDYGHVSRLAERWRIAAGVMIDPAISLGKPTVERHNITTVALAAAFKANGRDAGFVADLYRLEPSEVMAAVKFEESLKRAA